MFDLNSLGRIYWNINLYRKSGREKIMITKIGIGSVVGGFLLALFNGISGFMGIQNFWVGLTISKFIGEDRSESIILLTEIEKLQNLLDTFFYELPLFGILIGFGVLLLIVGLFVKEH